LRTLLFWLGYEPAVLLVADIRFCQPCCFLANILLALLIQGMSFNILLDPMSPLSGAEKHPDFQVTLCLRNVSTHVDFAYIESE